ncbi:unnamed protein product [Sphagnum jensenii]|uniref:Uncharacterized protein n=1 Tax=Sphagnum jensenii TaxID=128206 RepID=A0ABP1ASS8_9BRYO
MTDRGTYIHRRQQDAYRHTGRTFIDDSGMDMHRTIDDVHSSSTTARRTFIHRQTDRGRIFIVDSGTDMHRTTEDVRSSTDGGCTFIDDGRGSSGTQPSRDRRCGRCVGVGREREGESITRTRSAPISFAPISFASFAAAASSASKAHAQVSLSKIDMCS